jgi:hypothetical protein
MQSTYFVHTISLYKRRDRQGIDTHVYTLLGKAVLNVCDETNILLLTDSTSESVSHSFTEHQKNDKAARSE